MVIYNGCDFSILYFIHMNKIKFKVKDKVFLPSNRHPRKIQ